MIVLFDVGVLLGFIPFALFCVKFADAIICFIDCVLFIKPLMIYLGISSLPAAKFPTATEATKIAGTRIVIRNSSNLESFHFFNCGFWNGSSFYIHIIR